MTRGQPGSAARTPPRRTRDRETVTRSWRALNPAVGRGNMVGLLRPRAASRPGALRAECGTPDGAPTGHLDGSTGARPARRGPGPGSAPVRLQARPRRSVAQPFDLHVVTITQGA